MRETIRRAYVYICVYSVERLGRRELRLFNYSLSVKDTEGKLTFLTIELVSESLDCLEVGALKYQRRLFSCKACPSAGSLHLGQWCMFHDIEA
jgi:hypothetical protein